ncbi:MAG: 30S ribosomal protein S4 [Candidatus Aenigmatarchaeota archaeon]
MKRQRRKYEKPKRPFDKDRLEKEKELMNKYGLKKKQELWRAEALLRKFRRLARQLASKRNKELEKVLLEKLDRLGILINGKSLDDVLSLTVENILDRRLQTIVFKKGFANTIKQARQLIAHGHVLIENRKVNFPSYLVKKDEEDKIQINIPIQLKAK